MRRAPRAVPLACALAALCALARPACAQEAAPRERAWFSLGVLSGSTMPDSHLADYQWDVTPHLAWGARALAGRGRFAAGVRLWRSQTTQTMDPSLSPVSPSVRSTSVEFVGRARLASLPVAQVFACASAGRLHIGYAPDQVTLATGAGPVDVRFTPVDSWIAGGGVAFERALRASWLVGLELDHQFFGLDTAHRSGGAIVDQHESFGDWSARLELARRFSLTEKGTSR